MPSVSWLPWASTRNGPMCTSPPGFTHTIPPSGHSQDSRPASAAPDPASPPSPWPASIPPSVPPSAPLADRSRAILRTTNRTRSTSKRPQRLIPPSGLVPASASTPESGSTPESLSPAAVVLKESEEPLVQLEANATKPARQTQSVVQDERDLDMGFSEPRRQGRASWFQEG